MATATIPFRRMGVFTDEVFSATDLNRRSSEVFKSALKHPVTIARNNEQFALLRREQAAELVKAVSQLGEAVKLFLGVNALRDHKEPPLSVSWVNAFDDEERIAMLTEVFGACKLACGDGNWEPVRDIIHAWHESALVASSGVLDEMMASERDEQPITRPNAAGCQDDPEQ